jgi:tRNA(Ser,Leu) C12 N-acetylase TAN1
MTGWNVVATLREGDFARGMRFLGRFGPVAETGFYNVVILSADDPRFFLDQFEEARREDPEGAATVTRAVPVPITFTFQSAEEFEEKARLAAASFVRALAGKSFHVRMRRRGFRGKISGMAEEQFLDVFLKKKLEEAGTPGRIDFEAPDAIVVVETVGTQGGMAVWTREEMKRYPLLHVE